MVELGVCFSWNLEAAKKGNDKSANVQEINAGVQEMEAGQAGQGPPTIHTLSRKPKLPLVLSWRKVFDALAPDMAPKDSRVTSSEVGNSATRQQKLVRQAWDPQVSHSLTALDGRKKR